MERDTLSVVVPTYNERDRLEPLVEALFGALGARAIPAEVLVVDDNSPDGTGALAESLAGRFPVRVVHRPAKLGLGSAVMDGFRAASGRLLAVLDGDQSHPPEVLPDMVAALEALRVDMVVGSRYVPGGSWRNWPRRRLVLSRLGCMLARPLTPVRDAMSGLFLVRREAVEGVEIAATGFKICLELQLRGKVRSVAEMPYTFVDREGGVSKMSRREAVNYLKQLALLYRFRLSPGAAKPDYHRLAPRQLDALRAAGR